jgi:hypothetical protein
MNVYNATHTYIHTYIHTYNMYTAGIELNEYVDAFRSNRIDGDMLVSTHVHLHM